MPDIFLYSTHNTPSDFWITDPTTLRGGSTSYSITGSGGYLSTGTATFSVSTDFSYTTSSGYVSGGTATIGLDIPMSQTGTGGYVSSGTATVSTSIVLNYTTTGGYISGGTGTVSLETSLSLIGTSGYLSDGTATITLSSLFSLTTTGGYLSSGSTTVDLNVLLDLTGSGGYVSSGSSTLVFEGLFEYISNSGYLSGGEALIEFILPEGISYDFLASGGYLSGGSTTPELSTLLEVSGSSGYLSGGTATVIFNTILVQVMMELVSMNTGEMVTEVKASLGNRTDITDCRMVGWINWSIKRLVTFLVRRRVDLKYFHVLEKTLNFRMLGYAGAVVAGAYDTFTLSPTDVNPIVNYHKDWIVEIDTGTGLGQKRVIASSTGLGVCTVDSPWDIVPVGGGDSTYLIYQRSFSLDEAPISGDSYDDFWAVQRLERISDGAPLTQVSWQEVSGLNYTEYGQPSKFARRGNRLIFDTTPNEGGWYRIWYYAYPPSLNCTDLTAYTIMPTIWHEAIVLGAIFRGHRALMEPDRAREAETAWNEELANMVDENDLEGMTKENTIKVRFK